MGCKFVSAVACVRLSELVVDPQIMRCDLEFVADFTKQELSYALSRFIREVRRLDGCDLIHQIVFVKL